MPLPVPHLLPSEMFFDYTVSVLWIGTLVNGNQQIPLDTLNGITFPDSSVQTTAAGTATATIPWVTNAGNYTFQNTDNSHAFVSNQPTNLVYILPTPTGTTFLNGWFAYVKNGSTTNTITFTPQGATTIDGMAALVLQVHTAMLIVSDGTNYHSLVISPVGNNLPNLVFASPASGSGAPSMRSLVAADLPAGAGTFLQATVTLTAAQILALSTTPITLVPAPGAGFYICPSYFYMQFHSNGTAYAGSGDCYFIYGPPPEVNPTNLIALYAWLATSTGVLKSTVSTTFMGISGEGLVPYTTCNNAAVVFTAPTAVTGGNGTLTITLNYSVLPLP